jgi:hypothetical protein
MGQGLGFVGKADIQRFLNKFWSFQNCDEYLHCNDKTNSKYSVVVAYKP